MKRILNVTLLLLIISILSSIEYLPNQMIIKTTEQIELKRGSFGLNVFDNFLSTKSVKNIKSLTNKADNKYFVITFNDDLDWDNKELLEKKFSGIEYIQPNYINNFYYSPNDSLYNSQEVYLKNVKLPQAWEVTTGNSNVLIGVIDERDNDPTDETEHGTHVAGIIGADSNNGIGIVGACPNAKLLIIRAGFGVAGLGGYLQDDDCAAALIYATDMGVDVINTSWGDPNFSQIIADACQYAYDRGVTICSASGNDGTTEISYPAKLTSTIAVGSATNFEKSTFSSYGLELDLLAPGYQILSTYDPQNEMYNELSGTSMAAPYVTGAVALLKSLEPELTPEQIRGRLAESCYDVYSANFDIFSGYGLLNVEKLLTNNISKTITITYPYEHMGISESIEILGTVKSDDFFRYTVMYTTIKDPIESDWLDVETHLKTPRYYFDPVEDGVIAFFDVNEVLVDDNYLLRVELSNNNNNKFYNYISIEINQTEPILKEGSVSFIKRYNNDIIEYYIKAEYNEKVNLEIDCVKDNFVREIYSSYVDSLHIVKIPENLAIGTYDAVLTATNLSNLFTQSENFENLINIENLSIPLNNFHADSLKYPLIPTINSKNNTFAAMNLKSSFDKVALYQIQDNQIDSLWTVAPDSIFKPIDISINYNGELELLGIHGSMLEVYNVSNPITQKILGNVSFTGAIFADYDNDGDDEIIAVKDEESQRLLALYNRFDNSFVKEFVIENPTATNERIGFSPIIKVYDFDQDGNMEVIACDNDGDIMIFEVYSDKTYEMIWTTRLEVPHIRYMALGDFTGDNNKEFCVGGYIENTANPNQTYIQLKTFKYSNANSFEEIDCLEFSQVEKNSSINSADLDGDGDDELVLALAPNLYFFDFTGESFSPIWRGASKRTLQVLPFSKTNNQKAAVIVNRFVDNEYQSSIVSLSEPFDGPDTPLAFKVIPLNENSVKLTWLETQEQGISYNIYIQEEAGISLIAQTDNNSEYILSALETNKEYKIAIKAISENYIEPESKFTLWKTVIPTYIPEIISIKMIDANLLKICFSNHLNSSAINIGHYYVNHGYESPTSAILIENESSVVLKFNKIFEDFSDYKIEINGLLGETGILIEDRIFNFNFSSDITPPHIVDYEILEKKKLKISFSEDLSSESANLKENFSLILPNDDKQNSILTLNCVSNIINVIFSKELEPSNQQYYLKLNSITDIAGNKIQNNDNILAFSLTEIRGLKYIETAPNPLNINEFSKIDFIRLPLGKSGKISIFNLNGNLVFKDNIEPLTYSNNVYSWKAINNANKKVSSGMYFYILKIGNEIKKGKIAIVR